MKRGTTPFQADILELQRELFVANQKRIDAAVDGYTVEFEKYAARYRRTVRKVDGPVEIDTLIQATRDADVVLVGDYHTFAQAQRTFFRLLRRQPKEPNVTIALEMFQHGHEKDLDRFVRGRIKASTLLRRVNHAERWPFGSLTPLEPVFELARERGWRIIGVDATKVGATLAERDELAAELVGAEVEEGRRVFVLIGEMHLAPSHLPKAVREVVGRKPRVLRVHQNPERIWFDQAADGVPDEHEVLRLSKDAFALLSASPVACQQSFLTWLDRIQDGEIDDPRAIDPETGAELFKHSAKMIARILGIPLGRALDKVEIVGPANLAFFDRLCRSGMFTRDEATSIKSHILASESYYVPRAKLVYLATYSVNHAAEEASHFLRHHASHEGLEDPQGMVDAFYGRILNEAVGFMGSKLVNPKRKCVHVRDLERVVASAPEPTRRGKKKRKPRPRLESTAGHEPGGLSAIDTTTAQFVLAHKRMERGEHVPWLSEVFDAGADLFNAVTHVLGYILGDHLYYALARGVITKAEAKQLYYEPIEDEGASLMLYFELIARVGHVRIPKRT